MCARDSTPYVGRGAIGRRIDRSELRNVRLGAGELISGVDEALQGMRPGAERTAVVPPGLVTGQGLVLVFRIQLTTVQ